MERMRITQERTISISTHTQERDQSDITHEKKPGYYARPGKYHVNYLPSEPSVSMDTDGDVAIPRIRLTKITENSMLDCQA